MKLNNSKIKAEIIKLHPEVEEKSTSYITLIYNQIKKSLINGELKPGEKLDEGKSEKQIYDYLENKYGKWILYDPKFAKNTYFLWLLPILLFIIGGVIILKLFIIKKN